MIYRVHIVMAFDHEACDDAIENWQINPPPILDDVYALYENAFHHSYQSTSNGFDDNGAYEIVYKFTILLKDLSKNRLEVGLKLCEIATNIVNQPHYNFIS